MGIKDVLERMKGRGSAPEGAADPDAGPARRGDDLTVRLAGSGVARARSGPPPPRRPEEQTTQELTGDASPAAAALERRTRDEARARREAVKIGRLSSDPPTVTGVLVAIDGELEGQVVSLGSGETRLGRSRDCDVVLASARISREHALVVCEDGLFAIAPLSERNPTVVNGDPTEGTELKDGDHLRLGDTLFQFRTVEAP